MFKTVGDAPSEFAPLIQEEPANRYETWKTETGLILKKNSWKILIWVVAAIVSNVGQTIYLQKASAVMSLYPYFLFWFTCVPFVLIFFIYWAFIRFATNQMDGQAPVPQYKYFILGLTTTLNGLLMLFAAPNVPGLMQALLGPTISTIPLSMVCSVIFLKTRYNWKQVVAVCVILSGVVVAIMPSILQLTQKHGESNSTDSESFGTVYWNSMFLAGSIPVSLNYVYQERAFKAQTLHIASVLFASTCWQFLTILLSFPLDAIPHFGTAKNFKDIFTQQGEAFQCLAGHNISACPPPLCQCHNAAVDYSLFIIFYCLSSFTMLGVVKYGNATFAFVVSTLVTPISEFLFAWRLIMGDNVEKMSYWNYISLGVILLGVVFYRVFDKATTAKVLLVLFGLSFWEVILPPNPAQAVDDQTGSARLGSSGIVGAYAQASPKLAVVEGPGQPYFTI